MQRLVKMRRKKIPEMYDQQTGTERDEWSLTGLRTRSMQIYMHEPIANIFLDPVLHRALISTVKSEDR